MATADQKWQALQRLLASLDIDLKPKGFKNLSVYGLAKAEEGDHMVVRSVVRGTEDVIWHHGIYMGDEKVAHMHPEGNVSIVSLKRFVNEAVTVDTYVDEAGVIDYGPTDSKDRRALSVYLAEWATTAPEMQAIVYNVVGANCECFATWCRTGRYVGSLVAKQKGLLSSVPLSGHMECHSKAQKFVGLPRRAGGSQSRL
jgi:Lecithin retinol acyltransferase